MGHNKLDVAPWTEPMPRSLQIVHRTAGETRFSMQFRNQEWRDNQSKKQPRASTLTGGIAAWAED